MLISTVAIAIRRMSITQSTETLTIYQLSLIASSPPCCCPSDSPCRLARRLLMAGAGIGNGVAQYWWTRSLHLAPPSAVVPFNYLSLVWAVIIGYIVWGDRPTRAC